MSKLLCLVTLLAAAAGCSSRPDPMDTGSTCPPGSTLTYDNFAKGFMERYCTRCHDSSLHGSARQGAPLFHDFDTERGILNVANHVDEYAAAGPLAVNTLMPNDDGASPTVAERYQLGEWIACALDALENPDAGVDAMPLDAGVDAP
ncbi:MAG TPA: hypothetical protein VHE35_00500 [Kofleriaceae bacterium]|nr:hypothetical protein [Kofleriaceae bacterium]